MRRRLAVERSWNLADGRPRDVSGPRRSGLGRLALSAAFALALGVALCGCPDLEVVARDPGFSCVPGETEACYEGPSWSAGAGECRAGVRACIGRGFGPCAGQVLPAAERCDTPEVDESCDGAASCEGLPSSGAVLGDAGEQWGHLLASTDDGGAVVLAYGFESSGVFQPEGTAIEPWSPGGLVVARTGRDASLRWVRPFGAEGGVTAIGAAIDAPGGLTHVSGVFSDRTDLGEGPVEGTGLFRITLSDRGHLLERQIVPLAAPESAPLSTMVLRSLALSSDGRLLMAAKIAGDLEIGGTVIEGAAETHVVLGCLDADGAVEWSVTIASDDGEIVHAVFDTDGSALIAGHFREPVDLGDVVLPVIDPSGSLGDPGDIVLLRIGRDGARTLARSFPAAGEQIPAGMAILPGGDFVVGAEVDDGFDLGGGLVPTPLGAIAIARFSQDGETSWQRAYGQRVELFGFAGDLAGNLALTATFEDEIDFGDVVYEPLLGGPHHALVAKLDGQGGLVWARSTPIDTLWPPMSVAATPSGDVWVAGTLRAKVAWPGADFVLAPTSKLDPGDVLLTRFSP